MDVSEEHGLDPSMVVVDHNNEETVREVLIEDIGLPLLFTRIPKWEVNEW